jgi:hypothetical protein
LNQQKAATEALRKTPPVDDLRLFYKKSTYRMMLAIIIIHGAPASGIPLDLRKDADQGIDEVKDVKKRLTALTKERSH